FFSLAALLVRYVDKDMDYLTTPVIIGIAAAGVIAGLGCLLGNIIKINSKVNKTSTGMQGGLPVIEWESVQYLLDEN
ncbi:MAG: hypothetical protein K2J60_01895, partial [Acetatifactor sp.]|nr:hypothetical protein [Acetatifactor sp.]